MYVQKNQQRRLHRGEGFHTYREISNKEREVCREDGVQRCGDVEGAWRGLGNDSMEVKSRSRKQKGNLVSGNWRERCVLL